MAALSRAVPPLAKIAQTAQPAKDTVATVFELAGFAGGSAHRVALENLASAHLDTLRKQGVDMALKASTGKSQ